MTETLLSWAGEAAASPAEYWERDAGMSTVDSDVWIFGDTPRKLASDHSTQQSITYGSTWTQSGVEQGTGTGSGRNFPGVTGSAGGERRWPTGVIVETNGTIDVTFARVDAGNGYQVIGWGVANNPLFPPIFDETGGLAAWGSPRWEVTAGVREIWIQRTATLTEIAADPQHRNVLTRRILDDPGTEVELSMPPWGLEMYTQWGDRQALCCRNAAPSLELYQSFDRTHWTLLTTITMETGSRNAHAHATNYGCVLTWWDGTLQHMVRRLIAFDRVPYPVKASKTAHNTKATQTALNAKAKIPVYA